MAKPASPRGRPRLVLSLGLVLLLSSACSADQSGRLKVEPSAAVPSTTANDQRRYVGEFTPVGSMNAARQSPGVVALADGRILFVGGRDGQSGGFLASAEIFDPQTGFFSPTGSTAEPRLAPAAARLTDGRVLVTGGEQAAGQPIASAQLYDPQTGTFSATGAMRAARSGATATLLADGRILIVGGDPGLSAQPEIYNPRSGTFASTGPLLEPRFGQTATLLADGRVLIAGGSGRSSTDPLTSAELFDPQTGLFSATGAMLKPRSFYTATRLADGRVLLAGGYLPLNGQARYYLDAAELFDPPTGRFSATGSLIIPRDGHRAIRLADGRVLIVGGEISDGTQVTYLPQAEIYDPQSGNFSLSGTLGAARTEPAVALLADGRVLIAGGRNAQGYLKSAEIYH